MRYYSALSDVAEKRYQHAEWRIKRMKLQEKRLELTSDDTESVITIRSPNNNEDLQDINRNLSILNSLHLEEMRNSNVDTENNTESVDTVITNYNMNISDVQNNIEASNRQLNINNSRLDANNCGVCVTQCYESKVDGSVVSEKSQCDMSEDHIVEHITTNKSSKVETDPEWDRRISLNMQTAEVVSVTSFEVTF